VITDARARIGDRCAVNSGCIIGLVDLGDDALVGPRVVLLEGGRQHGVADLLRPMNIQPGKLERVRIDEDVWIGAGAVVMADVAAHTVISPNATVDRTFAPYDILGGVPARPTGSRLSGEPDSDAALGATIPRPR
jgi:acetyltransferase-like isoleucine patch superfamily enzyme